MGDAADDVLDGFCCEGCGEWFDDVLNGAEAPGHTRRCERCKLPSRYKVKGKRPAPGAIP